MQMVGQPIPDWAEGELLPTFGGAVEKEDRYVYALEAKSNPKYSAMTEATAVIYQNDIKLIRYFGYNDDDQYEMYNLKDDPEELNNIYESEKGLADALTAVLLDKISASNAPYRTE
jgi:arylsulfatase A-like enzyme